jgi:hypothetical protein
MSWLSLRPDVSNPCMGHVWRHGGEVFADIRLGKDADMVFASPADARAVAAACIEAAGAMEQLAAEGEAEPARGETGDGG